MEEDNESLSTTVSMGEEEEEDLQRIRVQKGQLELDEEDWKSILWRQKCSADHMVYKLRDAGLSQRKIDKLVGNLWDPFKWLWNINWKQEVEMYFPEKKQ